MGAHELTHLDFSSGNWRDLPDQLLQTPKIQRDSINGADEIANLLLERYSKPVTQSVRNG